MVRVRRMLSNTLVVLVSGLMVGVTSAAGRPRPEKANWDNVKQLLPDEQVRVVLSDAKSYRGLTQTVNDDAIALHMLSGDQMFKREDILRVSSRGEPHRGRNAAIGAGIGTLAAGAIFAAAIGSGYGMLVGILPGGGVGAIAGAVLPTGGWQDVYRAPNASSARSHKVMRHP
jgi:hypothetical protein